MGLVKNVMITMCLVALAHCASLERKVSDGTNMVGVTCDNKLATKTRAHGDWTRAKGSCCVQSVAVLADGTLLGVGEDKMLYTKKSPRVGEWEGPLENTCCIKTVAVMPDGTILATNRDEELLIKTDLTDLETEWKKISANVRAVEVFSDGKILALTNDSNLKIRNGVKGNWRYYGGVGHDDVITDIAIQADDTVVGVGKRRTGLYFLNDNKQWDQIIENKDCIKSVASTGVLVGENTE